MTFEIWLVMMVSSFTRYSLLEFAECILSITALVLVEDTISSPLVSLAYIDEYKSKSLYNI